MAEHNKECLTLPPVIPKDYTTKGSNSKLCDLDVCKHSPPPFPIPKLSGQQTPQARQQLRKVSSLFTIFLG